MRERHRIFENGILHFRITPARAGKTLTRASCWNCLWDHPRSCGKDPYRMYQFRLLSGSPPLVRERPIFVTVPILGLRITPARAGKTLLVPLCIGHYKDHPRSCGKDHPWGKDTTGHLGSPPLVRERHCISDIVFLMVRITPARAGKTVMDPFICAISLLPVFKIYLISFQSISTLQLLRNLGGC